MRALSKPCGKDGRTYVAENVFALCVSKTANADRKKRLQAAIPVIGVAARHYDTAATETKLHKLPKNQTVRGLTNEELIKVYESGMLRASAPGRDIYNRILNGPVLSECPLCGVGFVTTLDHHLPKSRYPLLAVAPSNLVPACTWCQTSKKQKSPQSAEEETLHPYFDKVDQVAWLKAEVVRGRPAAFRYFVVAPDDWPDLLAQRVENHFKTFRLATLYSVYAARELNEITDRLTSDLEGGGPDKIRDVMMRDAKRMESVSLNSWKAAMYRAAAASSWFCKGGFLTPNQARTLDVES